MAGSMSSPGKQKRIQIESNTSIQLGGFPNCNCRLMVDDLPRFSERLLYGLSEIRH